MGETLIGAEAMQSSPLLGRLRKALDKTAPTTAAQSAAATHSTTKRLKTGKSSKAKDTNDEDDEVDLLLDDDDYDVIIQNQQQDVEAGPASQNPSTKDGSKKQSKHPRGAKRKDQVLECHTLRCRHRLDYQAGSLHEVNG